MRSTTRFTVVSLGIACALAGVVSVLAWTLVDGRRTVVARWTAECARRWEGRMTRLLPQGMDYVCQVQDRQGWWVPEKNFIVRGAE